MSNESLGNYSEENARLLVQYQELAELAGALAHEIKNPLSVIRMNMDLLEEDFEKSESARDRRVLQKIGIVSRQCTRLENLLNDFLKFTRLRELELRPGNLNEQIERVLELYEGALRDNPIVISRFYDAHLPAIMMHPETLQAALVNLVKNAIEAMPNGGKLVVITQGTRSGVALEMIDSGCGIAGSASRGTNWATASPGSPTTSTRRRPRAVMPGRWPSGCWSRATTTC